MASLVGALASEKHPQLPGRIRKVSDRSRRAFGCVHLLVHLPVHELQHLARISLGKVCAFLPGVDDLEARVAGRAVGKRVRVAESVHGQACVSCPVTSDSRSCCLSSTAISSSVNSASWRSATFMGADCDTS